MTTQLDPITYLRFPKPDVATAISLAKILIHRVPKGSPPAVRKAAAVVEESVGVLEAKWMEQAVHVSRDLRPLARRVGSMWSAIRDRLVTYESFPEDNADRRRAMPIHDMLFADGLEFLTLAFPRQHAESERRLRLIDSRGLAKDLDQLVGARFLAALRASHQAHGDALGINKASLPAAPVFVAEELRVLTDAISGYALQLLALARHDPEKRDAVVVALSPIDEFRAAAGRRVVAEEDEEDVVDPNAPAANAPVEADPLATGTE